MNNQEYLDKMTPEQKERNQIEGIAGIINLYADLIKEGEIIVNPNTLQCDRGKFSFEYIEKK